LRGLDPTQPFGRCEEMEHQLSRPISALDAPQAARASLRLGNRFLGELEVRTTPAGLLAIGGLVAAILLSVPPIIRAAAEASEARKSPAKGKD
jgi:hypothetical protein